MSDKGRVAAGGCLGGCLGMSIALLTMVIGAVTFFNFLISLF